MSHACQYICFDFCFSVLIFSFSVAIYFCVRSSRRFVYLFVLIAYSIFSLCFKEGVSSSKIRCSNIL